MSVKKNTPPERRALWTIGFKHTNAHLAGLARFWDHAWSRLLIQKLFVWRPSKSEFVKCCDCPSPVRGGGLWCGGGSSEYFPEIQTSNPITQNKRLSNSAATRFQLKAFWWNLGTNLNLKGWNPHIRMESPRCFESTNLSRDNESYSSREMGRSPAGRHREVGPVREHALLLHFYYMSYCMFCYTSYYMSITCSYLGLPARARTGNRRSEYLFRGSSQKCRNSP